MRPLAPLARLRHRRRQARLDAPPRRPRGGGWALAGATLGVVLGGIAFAPASWLASAVAQASGERVLLSDAQGTLWSGHARLVLSGGEGSRQAMVLPDRLRWQLRLSGASLRLAAQLSCCLHPGFALLARPGIGRMRWELAALPESQAVVPAGAQAAQTAVLVRWPIAWMAALGAPWNTLRLSGDVQLRSAGLSLESAQGREALNGSAELQLQSLASPLAALPQLGSYRVMLQGQGGDGGVLQLVTAQGPLMLSGTGQWSSAGGLRFRGQAQAQPGSEAALDTLLNLIGRRQGALSNLSIG